MTEVPVADLNLVYIPKNTKALDKILIQARQFYDTDNLSFVVIIPQDFCPPEIENILKGMGYSQIGKSVAMAIKLEDFTRDNVKSSDEEILIQANDHLLNDWMIPLVGAFESTVDISSIYADAHERALKKNRTLRHFSLYKQETPIVSVTLSLCNGSARIDDVGTLPEFQKKGYVTRLLTYVLLEAKKLKARHCFLEASDSGFGVYEKLGFEPLFKNNIYSRKT